jgi:hypothetical protein
MSVFSVEKKRSNFCEGKTFFACHVHSDFNNGGTRQGGLQY